MQIYNKNTPNVNKISKNENGLLAKLFRAIMGEWNYWNSTYIEVLINQCVENDKENSDSASDGEKRLVKSTLKNNIISGEMTFRVFLTLLFKLMRIDECTIILETKKNGETRRVSLQNITLSNEHKNKDNRPKDNKEKE